MFTKNTVFILGAGASYPYGYPLGKELISMIISLIDQETIFLPSAPGANNESDISIALLKEPLDRLNYEEILKSSWGNSSCSSQRHGLYPYAGLDQDYYPFKLNKFSECRKLSGALKFYRPVTIDSFLEHHEDLAEVGKIMIIYALLEMEHCNIFSEEIKNTNKDETWYPHVQNDLFAGCSAPEDILKNKIKFCSFNYDLSLDYYFITRILEHEFLKNKLDDSQMNELKNLLKVHHIYGSLYKLINKEEYGQLSGKAETEQPQKEKIKFCRFLKAFLNRSNIKLIGERTNGCAVEMEHIKNASDIIIIGFGFDRSNLTVLGFPNDELQYLEFLENKTIKYLDFDGKMNTISDQFSQLKDRFKNFNYIRSQSKAITDAYTNDFKLSLF